MVVDVEEEEIGFKKLKGKFMIQIAGKPKEIVEEALEKVFNQIKEDYEVLEGEIVEPELEEETTLYSGLLELDIKFEDIEELFGFVVEYTPVSIELEEPLKTIVEIQSINSMMNDFSHHILKLNEKIRELEAQIYFLSKNQKK